jgi:hypothetical protein
MKILKYILLCVFLSSLLNAQQNNNEWMMDICPDIRHQSFSADIETIWDVKFNYALKDIIGANASYGAVYIHTLNQFWTTKFLTGWIHAWNPDGTLIDSFTIAGVNNTRNMAFDGEYVWHATTSNSLAKVDPVTRTRVALIFLTSYARFISYDPDADNGNGGFWVGDWGSSSIVYLVNKNGSTIRQLTIPLGGIAGIAYDYWSPGGPFIWAWSQQGGQGAPQYVYQINAVTGTFTGVQRDIKADIGGSEMGVAGGLFITDKLLNGIVVLGGLYQGDPDRLFGYEIHVLDAGPLMPFNLHNPASGVTIESFPHSSTTVSFVWDTSRTLARYNWVFGSPEITDRKIVLNSSTNILSITLGQLDNLLEGIGVQPDKEIIGVWDVWALRGNAPHFDSLKSTNGPRTITLKRGQPLLLPFALHTPINNSHIYTHYLDNSIIQLKWFKSGEGIAYKIKFGVEPGNPLFTFNANYDTTFSIKNSDLDKLLNNTGVQRGESIVGKWSVWAYDGGDSLKSATDFNLILQRHAKNNLIAFDSTSTDGRKSRDSIIAALNKIDVNYDLYNKGDQFTTSSMSFRGFQTVIWLGEGSSVMSVVQKDSVKAYLNSGTPIKKATLIIFAEDIGYQFGRSASNFYDLDFVNNYLGLNFVSDRPAGLSEHGLVCLWGSYQGTKDSTIGAWPEVFSLFGPNSVALYRYRMDPLMIAAVGNKTNNFEVSTMGQDVRSLRAAVDSPPGSPVSRLLAVANQWIPVEFILFQANVEKRNVILNWITATETNNKGFEIQRRDNPGEFINLGFVNGSGTVTTEKHYTFSDNSIANGLYTYRLKQIDFDGTYKYSNEINVEIKIPYEFSLSQNYPNPFNPSTVISFMLPVDSKVEITVYDILGRKIHSHNLLELNAGSHNFTFDGSRLSSGVYFYKLNAQGLDGTQYGKIKKMILNK